MALAKATVIFLLCVTLTEAASLRRVGITNVPTGECYECEVTCFEDCLLKYDREIIAADADRAKQYEREKRHKALKKAANARKVVNPNAAGQEVYEVLKDVFSKIPSRSAALAQAASQNSTIGGANQSHQNSTAGHSVFNWRRGGTSRSDEVSAVVAHYAQCLESEKCRGHRATLRKLSTPWAARELKNPACQKPKHLNLLHADNTQCSGPADHFNCSVTTCGLRALQPKDSFVQKDEHVPLHPVKVGSFSKGVITLETCMKSCLAATCGCMHGDEKLDGFEKIDHLEEQIRKNDEAGNPVLDTPPEYTYRPAFMSECGNGAEGIKVNKGLYSVFHQGWLEVCSEDYLKAMMIKDVKGATEHCQDNNETAVDYGCVWSPFKGACVWGLKPIVRCSVRELKDKKF